ncbi:MAG: IS630 transposase-related protein [Cyanobacteria bacterium P01_E01_bin.35]
MQRWKLLARLMMRLTAVHNWLKRDNLAPTKVKHRDRKLNWKALEQHIQDEPDAKLKERAEHFGVHTTAIWYAIKQMNITRKSGATPLIFNQQGNAHQDKTVKVSRAQSSRETRVSPTITTDRSTTGKSEFNLQDANVVLTIVYIKIMATPS